MLLQIHTRVKGGRTGAALVVFGHVFLIDVAEEILGGGQLSPTNVAIFAWHGASSGDSFSALTIGKFWINFLPDQVFFALETVPNGLSFMSGDAIVILKSGFKFKRSSAMTNKFLFFPD